MLAEDAECSPFVRVIRPICVAIFAAAAFISLIVRDCSIMARASWSACLTHLLDRCGHLRGGGGLLGHGLANDRAKLHQPLGLGGDLRASGGLLGQRPRGRGNAAPHRLHHLGDLRGGVGLLGGGAAQLRRQRGGVLRGTQNVARGVGLLDSSPA